MTNCHTPESAGNFVGPDETIVNGMVCKVVKIQPAQQQIVAQHSPASAPDEKDQPNSGHGLAITNSRVVEMSKLGLDDDIIIAKIKNGSCDFKLEDTDLVQLKRLAFLQK